MRISDWSSDVCSSDLLATESERPKKIGEEEHHADRHDRIPDRGDMVPIGEGIGIIRNAPRHAVEPEEVNREEDQDNAAEENPEMDLAYRLLHHPDLNLRAPVDIGMTSCREIVDTYGAIPVVAV